jgi:hypothetical protein
VCSTRTIILAVLALTLVCAWHIPLVTLTVLLLAPTVLALAPFEVLVVIYSLFEGLDVSLKDLLDGGLSFWNVEIVVVALLAFVLVALTQRSAGGLVSEALTVELETFCVLALTALALGHSWSVLGLLDELSLA